MYWFRNEVELKDFPIDVLLDISGYFAGICDFSASIVASCPVKVITKVFNRSRYSRRAKWARRQVGRTLADLAKYFDGDIEKVFGLLVSSEHQDSEFSLPDIHQKLLKEITG